MEGRIKAGWSDDRLLQPRIEYLKMGKGERGKEIRKWRALNDKSITLIGKSLEELVDLEEQGRLVVLPEKLDPKRLLNIIADLVCPRYVGLEDWGHDKEKCPSAGCNECWEKALKGEER